MVRCFPPLLTLVILLLGLVPAAWATGPLGPEIRFFSRSGQDPQDDLAYFRGRLGILRPTFTDNRLYAAYRIMLGGSVSDGQARQLLARCCDAPDTPADAVTSWNDLRKRVLGATPAQENTSFRQRPEDIRAFDVSCFPNAYRNSAATLRARMADHGANSPLVRDWVIGQDAVLRNCDTDSPLPGELPNAPAWLKADRAYQIAAAYFYRLDYARAGALFAEIARDASSPWQKTARYLVARCAVHAAIADKTPEAHRRCAAGHRRRRDRSGPRGLSRRSAQIGLTARLRDTPAGTRAGAGTGAARSRPAARACRSSCVISCCWSGPARATPIWGRGSMTSTF